jgi:hypothetical protein
MCATGIWGSEGLLSILFRVGNKTVSNPPWGRLFRQEKPFPGSDPLRGGSFQFTRSFRFGLRRDQADDEQEKGFHVSSSDDVFLLSYNSTK